MIKSRNRANLRKTLDAAIVEAGLRGCDMKIVNIEIDPVNLM